MPAPRPRVIGIGNEFRQDDGAGLAVARRLTGRSVLCDVVEHDGDGASLLQAWEGASIVILIDAVRSGAAHGTIHRIDVRASALPRTAAWSSSHSLGVEDAIELASRLDRLPEALFLYGIEGRRFGFGIELSPEVEAAVDALVDRLALSLGNAPQYLTG